jgi:hypothetical protein
MRNVHKVDVISDMVSAGILITRQIERSHVKLEGPHS